MERNGNIKAQKRKVWEALKEWIKLRRDEDKIVLTEERRDQENEKGGAKRKENKEGRKY